MTPERWKKINDVFQAAIERPSSEWAVFLETACAGDSELRKEVDSLLASYQQRTELVLEPVREAADELLTSKQLDPMVGRRVGAYRIVSEIGRGGMGVVYLAVRDDDQYKKQVAIKLVKRGMDSDAILQRFRNERQILAGLDHPNIVKLLDGGITEEGLPYFVMDYVKELPVTMYCDAQQLSVTQRLTIFLIICSAVHYAHQNLVVHRDIKPSNILVTPEGVPKVLDFGIAKLLNPAQDGQTLSLHRNLLSTDESGLRPLTPHYASPEQVRGEPITTASDIYSLGVLLYELLTSHRPHRITKYTPLEIERAICEQEPDRPSATVTRGEQRPEPDVSNLVTKTPASIAQARSTNPEKLRRRLTGDLDNIVLMALRKEPLRRYASVEQFAEDIKRHLEGMPVIARKDTLPYRSSKFIQRHWTAVAAVAAAILALLGGIFVSLRQAHVANRERMKAERVSELVQRMLSGADPTWNSPYRGKGRDLKVLEVLDDAAARLETELKVEPEVEAALRSTLGNTYRGLGLYEPAEHQLQIALMKQRGLLGEDHPATGLTLYYLGQVAYSKGAYAAGESYYRQALPIQRKAKSITLPNLISDLGLVLLKTGKYAEAEPLFEEALQLSRRAEGGNPVRTAIIMGNLGRVYMERGDINGAKQLFREAIETFRSLPGPPPMELCAPLIFMSSLLRVNGEAKAAEGLVQESLLIERKYLGDSHPYVALSLSELSLVKSRQGDYAAAEAAAREALDIQRKVLVPLHQDIAWSLMALGTALVGAGEPIRAEPFLREALAIGRTALPQGHWRTAQIAGSLGECLMRRGHYTEGGPLLKESYLCLKTSFGEDHPSTAEAKVRMARAHRLISESGTNGPSSRIK